MLSPILTGMLFGTRTLAGMLAGGLVSGVQMAVSMSNTGGAWDNAKKYIEVRPRPRTLHRPRTHALYRLHARIVLPARAGHACWRPLCCLSRRRARACAAHAPQAGASEHARELGGKGSDCHKAAVIGDTVGDPLKDTSGPSLNILIKLMAVESLVFAPFFYNVAGGEGLLFQFFSG